MPGSWQMLNSTFVKWMAHNILNSILPCGNIPSRTLAIPHTSVDYLPNNWLLVIPQVSFRRNLHRPLCHMSWGRRECWHGCHWILLCRRCWSGRAPNRRPGPWGCLLQWCWTCTTQELRQKGANVRAGKPKWGKGSEKAPRRNNFTLPELEFSVLSSKKSLRLKTIWSNNAPIMPQMRKCCVQVSIQQIFIAKCGWFNYMNWNT